MRRTAPPSVARRLPRPLLVPLALLVAVAVAAPVAGITAAGAATGGTVTSWNVSGTTPIVSSGSVVTTAAASHPKPLIGGHSNDFSWYDANVGTPTIYRQYDTGFTFTTWSASYLSKRAGTAASDLSIAIAPATLAGGSYDARLWTFVRSTPKNLIITNFHEPEDQIELGAFTAAQYRAAIARLATIVHGVNAEDGGNRRVSTILMLATLKGFKGRNPANYWPGKDANGRPYVDVVSFDTYALPHATSTPGVPAGYTDGVNWQTSAQLLDPVIAYAASLGTRWMVSEFGFLEDIHNPAHKGNAIIDFVNYARLHDAVAVEYWDSVGRRADWRLRYSTVATSSWKAAVFS